MTGAETTPAKPAKRRAESKHQRKQNIDVDAERRNHFPVIDAGPERGAYQCTVDHQYERKRDCNADGNDEQAIERILYPSNAMRPLRTSGVAMLWKADP